MIDECNLVDVYQHFNPESIRFSWRKRNPIKQARLDYFLISDSMTDIIDSCEIRSSYRSDHSIIEIHIVISKFKIGKGIWKFNNSLLKNKDYLELVNKIIHEEKSKYALPVYSAEYVKNENENIKFNIDDDDFSEMICLRIRGETIKFASYLKKQTHMEEKSLIVDIENLESLSDTRGQEVGFGKFKKK